MTGHWRYFLELGGREIELPEGEHVIGRSRGCQIPLSDSRASRRHARLVLAGGGATIEDLGSSNGTFVEGERVEKRMILPPGSTFHLGESELRLQVFAGLGEASEEAFGEATLFLQQASVDLVTRTLGIDVSSSPPDSGTQPLTVDFASAPEADDEAQPAEKDGDRPKPR